MPATKTGRSGPPLTGGTAEIARNIGGPTRAGSPGKENDRIRRNAWETSATWLARPWAAGAGIGGADAQTAKYREAPALAEQVKAGKPGCRPAPARSSQLSFG